MKIIEKLKTKVYLKRKKNYVKIHERIIKVKQMVTK